MEQTPTDPVREARGIALILGSVLLFTLTALLLSHTNRIYTVDGWVAAAYRALIGLAVICAMQGSTGKVDLRRIFTQRLLFLRGLIGGATIPLYYVAIMKLGPGRAGLISGAYPLFAALFAALFLGERIRAAYFIYIALAIGGLACVFANGDSAGGQPFYDLVALLGAVAGGICVVLIRHLRHTENTSNIFAAQCVFALLIGLIGGGAGVFISNPAALGLVVLAALTVAGGQLCITEAFRHVNVAKGSTLHMLTPALTVAASAALLGESFSLVELAGGAAILFASYRIVVAKT